MRRFGKFPVQKNLHSKVYGMKRVNADWNILGGQRKKMLTLKTKMRVKM